MPVWDADAAVHRLYAPGGGGAEALADLVPAAVAAGGVDRERLREALAANPALLAGIEARIHPLVAADRAAFATAHAGAEVLLYDIPLLYETGSRARPRRRPRRHRAGRGAAGAGAGPPRHVAGGFWTGSSPGSCPTPKSVARADFVIDTGEGLDAARAGVLSLLARIRTERRHA